jgi:hypothetical protein
VIAGGAPAGGPSGEPAPGASDSGAPDTAETPDAEVGDGDPQPVAGEPGSGSGDTATAPPPQVLSDEEIARRVEEKLPDGSLPPDQLEAARADLADEILTKSKQAASWATQAPTQ